MTGDPIQESPYCREYELFACWVTDDDTGAEVGQDAHRSRADLVERLNAAKKRGGLRDDVEYFAVEIAALGFAAEHPGEVALRNSRWTMESKALFKKFLAVCRAARKAAASDVPWPEWAIKAKAEGWKPPKGWKP